MDIPTWDEIRRMSPEEVRDANRRLAVQALRSFLTFHILKWAFIFAITWVIKKWAESLPE